MRKYRFAIIGAGSIAELAHLPTMTKTPQAELAAICDIDSTHAQKVAKQWGASAWFTDYEEMLADRRLDLDAVIVASPPNVHREHALAAAEAGCHLFVEKPLAVTNREAWDIVHAVDKARVKLMVGCDRRFWTQNQWAKQLVEQGVIGRVVMARTCMHEHVKHYQDNLARTDFRLRVEIAGGSAISDTGAHAIDLVTWLMGSPVKRVTGTAKQMALPAEYGRCDDTALALMEHENGSYTMVSCNRFTTAVAQFTELFGLEGSIYTSSDACNAFQSAPMAVYTEKDYTLAEMPEIIRKYRYPQTFWAEDLIVERPRQRWVAVYPPREPNNYTKMWAHFMDCLVNDRQPLVTGEDGARAIEVMCGVFKSMETGAWVDLPLTEEVVPPGYHPRR